jgi:hypothetical protein
MLKHVVTEPLHGYKIVDEHFHSLVLAGERKLYTVGTTVALGDDNVLPCCRGLHFCPNALDCLGYYDLSGDRRLLRVTVPVGATVATSDGGKKYAASVLHVDADVTADVDSLLTGVWREPERITCYQAGRMHRDTNDEPAVVRRMGYSVSKTWYRDGKRWNGCLGKFSDAGNDHGGRPWVKTATCHIATFTRPDETAAVLALLDRRESFEEDPDPRHGFVVFQ